MTTEVLITLGGLVLSVLTYFAGVWRTERRHKQDDREVRIQRVLQRYMEFRRTNYTAGLDGLQKSGVATLASNSEIAELAQRIEGHAEIHPLGSDHAAVFTGVDLHKFFQYAARERINFLQIPVQEVIAQSKAKA